MTSAPASGSCRGVPPVASRIFSNVCVVPASSVAEWPSRSTDEMRRPAWMSTPSSGVPRKTELSSLPVHRPLESGGRAYGSCCSAAEEADAPLGVVVADPARRGVSGHAASDDQVPVVAHRRDRNGVGRERASESRRRARRSALERPRGRDLGDRRRVPGSSRSARRAADRRARRDLLLPLVLDPRAGRRVGALVRRSRRCAESSRRRTFRAAASTRRPTPRSSTRRCVRSPPQGSTPSSSRGGGSARRRTSACRS